MRGWVKIVFGLSLMLNLLVGGVLVGGYIAHERRDMTFKRYDLGLGPLGSAFSSDDRREMREKVQRSGKNFGEMRGELRAELMRLLDILGADEWDGDAVRAQLARMHDHTANRVRIGETIMLQHLGDMSLQDRRDYVERLRQRLPELAEPFKKR